MGGSGELMKRRILGAASGGPFWGGGFASRATAYYANSLIGSDTDAAEPHFGRILEAVFPTQEVPKRSLHLRAVPRTPAGRGLPTCPATPVL